MTAKKQKPCEIKIKYPKEECWSKPFWKIPKTEQNKECVNVDIRSIKVAVSWFFFRLESDLKKMPLKKQRTNVITFIL